MKSYIVRIYRREKDNPENLLGTVETSESADKFTFKNRDELLSILDQGDGRGKRPHLRKAAKLKGKDGLRERKR